MLFFARVGLPSAADGFDLFGTRFWNQNDRAAFVSERFSYLAREVFLILVRKQFLAVHEQQERRRRLLDLGRVKELQSGT